MTTTTTARTETTPCVWCGDTTPGHKHYAVLIRENGKTLGRLTPDGHAVNRKLFAHVFGKARATEVAEEINTQPPYPGITAHVIRF